MAEQGKVVKKIKYCKVGGREMKEKNLVFLSYLKI
jgi:hypothetical protein